jgi:hypothetical protein
MTDRSRGDRYALAALKRTRGLLATEIVQLEGQLRHRKAMLGHVDATLKLLDPSVFTDAIPRRRPKRIKLFRQGELGRMILDVLRNASGPLPTAEIVASVIEAGGHGDGARTALAPRVRGNLAYLARRGKVFKTGNGQGARWRLA